MLDYKLLEALSAVAETGGFEKAADRLFITQSAVSQRIKLLEEHAGQILITRQTPPVPTEAGQKLIKHCRQVQLLEHELGNANHGGESPIPSISIGINADSLATWFLPALKPLIEKTGALVALKVDDQDETQAMLKNGEAAGCISSSSTPVQGCSMTRLGTMEYMMVSTKNFSELYFSSGLTQENILLAPALLYNEKDNLHNQFLELLHLEPGLQYPRHYIPSSIQFLDFIEMGLAYGVVPKSQYNQGDSPSSLIKLTETTLSVELFWHHWNIHSDLMETLTETVTIFADTYLGLC